MLDGAQRKTWFGITLFLLVATGLIPIGGGTGPYVARMPIFMFYLLLAMGEVKALWFILPHVCIAGALGYWIARYAGRSA
ncbi:MAG TPA: hypothetical protein PKM65_10025 [Spirochaetota bacterium]|nr:hypothetical protein [Spirochaetota bacterium]HNT12365.1 hypothetical protein [Spirochaetota bacterium]HNV46226.1 hypothetical protein [Spirochaetota bacterium]HOS38303.1 hypothetical protein [Spirochaetota bacterium]HPU87827.1 hypothetical protein [Spirochaetota bacterium]